MDDLELYASNEKSLESLIQTVRVFNNDIGMEFRVEKCAVMSMKKRKMTNSDGIQLCQNAKSNLGEGSLIFCCTGSQKNYFRSVGRQNDNNNPQFKGRHI